MSMMGFKKQWAKTSQLMSEKLGGETDKTRMDSDFVEMERKVDVMHKAIQDVIVHTKEYLQPNPTTRAKMNMMSTYQKIQGKQQDMKYPQTEHILGNTMIKYGNDLGEDSRFGDALKEVGEALQQLSEIKDSLDVGVKQDFIDPLQQLCDKDIKEVMHHRKKLSGRRLDYDYKRKKQGKIPPDEIQQAEQKLEESLEVADSSMFNLLSGDVEQVTQLQSFVESQLEYHRQSTDILESLMETMQRQIQTINSQPDVERARKQLRLNSISSAENSPMHSTSSINNSPSLMPSLPSTPPAPAPKPAQQSGPSCQGLYDFEPENIGELGFKEGEMIILTNKIDENWYEGINQAGDQGYFPCNYVEVIVPLP